MNNVAIAFSTKDRVELSKQSIQPLFQPNKFDLFWVDGSKTREGENLPKEIISGLAPVEDAPRVYADVTGGADAAIVFSLTTMLQHPNNYQYVGLVENDVLLDPDWFTKTMDLFVIGECEGLEVGAVSARSYEDRILIQLGGHAIMHNLGAGMVIFSRKAAELVLQNFRTGYTSENRRTFMQFAGLDIARWSGFIQQPHITCADWQFERILAQHGMVALALTPAKCQMIGQVPPLEEQGLTLTTGPVEERRDDMAFERLQARCELIRDGVLQMPDSRFLLTDDGNTTIFPHQIPMLGGSFEGNWSLKWCQGFGPFAWKAQWDGKSNIGKRFSENQSRVNIPVSGPCQLIVSGGEHGGRVSIRDEMSGYEITTEVSPEGEQGQAAHMQVPAACAYRNVVLTALSPGVTLYGLVVREPQIVMPEIKFDHATLPGV